MKIALVTDTHAGVRGDSPLLLDHQKEFWDKVFFPTLRDNPVELIVHLGDLVDKRKSLNYYTAKRLRADFLDRVSNFARMIVLAGNHDTFYKDTNAVNAFESVLSGYDNIHAYTDPNLYRVGGQDILMLPWICQENYQRSMELIERSHCKYALGHLEIAGFEMYKGSVADHGLKASSFNRFDMVASGHFHHKSTKGNIHYLGAPYEMVWSDADDPRGFHIFDTDSGKLTFHQNPFRLFHRIHYVEGMQIDPEMYRGKYVKIHVTNRGNAFVFDQLLASLESAGTYDVQVLEKATLANVDLDIDGDTIETVEDTISILDRWVGTIEYEGDRNKLAKFLKDLYQEARMKEAQ